MNRIWSYLTRACRARPTNSPSQTSSQCTEDSENAVHSDHNGDGTHVNNILKCKVNEEKSSSFSFLLLPDDKIVLSWKKDQGNNKNYSYNSTDSVVYGAASALLFSQIVRFVSGIVNNKILKKKQKDGENVEENIWSILNPNLQTVQSILPKVPSLPSVPFHLTAHAAGGSDNPVAVKVDHNIAGDSVAGPSTEDCVLNEKREDVALVCDEDLEKFYTSTKQCLGLTYNLQGLKNYRGGNYPDAFQLFKLGSEGGSKQAQFNLAICYQQGKGTKQDLKQAKREYYRASLQGHAIAQYNLALILLEERNGESVRKALFWLEKAAEKGLVEAQTLMGSYAAQVGSRQYNMEKAVKMFQLATDQQDPLSTYHLAGCYEYGLGGLEVDTLKAYDLYESAASYGHQDAHFKMAMILVNGCPEIEKDEKLAMEILKKAEDLGHKKSAQKLAQLKREAKVKSVARDLNRKYQFQNNISAFKGPQILLSSQLKKRTPKPHLPSCNLAFRAFDEHLSAMHRVESLPGMSLLSNPALIRSNVPERS